MIPGTNGEDEINECGTLDLNLPDIHTVPYL